MIVVSYWAGALYREHATKLASSVLDVGLKSDIHVLGDEGAWAKNIAKRPQFLLDMLEAHPEERILWLDVDCVIRRRPELLLEESFHGDVAMHFSSHDTPRAGTLWLRNTGEARRFLTIWQSALESGRDDVAALKIAANKQTGPHIHHLPPAYCWVEKTMRPSFPGAIPVIEHFEISKG